MREKAARHFKRRHPKWIKVCKASGNFPFWRSKKLFSDDFKTAELRFSLFLTFADISLLNFDDRRRVLALTSVGNLINILRA